MNTYEKLQRLYSEIDMLLDKNVTSFSDEFKIWHGKCNRLLVNYYGNDSIEVKEFINIKFQCALIDNEQQRLWCRNGLKTAKGMFESLLEDMEEESDNTVSTSSKELQTDKVFIVHGHDEVLKTKLSRLVEQQGIKPIILHEQDNLGKTIIEKIEHYGNSVGAAIVIFTPDDTGKSNNESEYKNRARQNVVFEAGYFLGYLGRDRIIPIVSDNSIELPGDLQGVVYTGDMWQFKVISELKAMGFNVDMNKIVF